jgi:tRNA threonylcarbamoyladenosine modification (KEOPS) complex Cgi121 subunit
MSDFSGINPIHYAPIQLDLPKIDIIVIKVLENSENSAKKIIDLRKSFEEHLDASCLCSLVDLDFVAGELHLRIAAYSALAHMRAGTMKTGSFGAEVQLRLAHSTNIKRVLEQNSVTDSTKILAGVFLHVAGSGEDNNTRQIQSMFEKESVSYGSSLAPGDIEKVAVQANRRMHFVKEYKLTEIEIATFGLQDSVLSKVATQEV